MAISARVFLQGSLPGGATLSAFGVDIASIQAQARTLKISRTSVTRSTCPYTNEFNYLVVKTMRSLGVCDLENRARL